MSLDEPQRDRLWHALSLGPRWRLRGAVPVPAAEAEIPPETRVEGRTGVVKSAAASTEVPAPAMPPARAALEGGAAAERLLQIARLGWEELPAAVSECRACGLCRGRRQAVLGVGAHDAHTLIVGEAPGAEEDARGEPFVGQAGKLLDQMVLSIGLSRTGSGGEGVYIANVLKCRPPGNRNPEMAEVAACEPYLLRQLQLLKPRRVLIMGRFAVQALLGTDAAIASLRGRIHTIRQGGLSVPAVVSYHPAYLLRNLAEKAKSWADLCLLSSLTGREEAAGATQHAAGGPASP